MILTARERFVCRSTKTKLNKPKQGVWGFISCSSVALYLICSLTPSRCCLAPGFLLFACWVCCPLCHQDVAHRERQSNSMATVVKIGSLTRGGGRKWFVLSCLVCSGRGSHSATLGLSGLTDHINTHTKSLSLLVSWTAACCHSLVESIAACGWSHIKMQAKVGGCLCVAATIRRKAQCTFDSYTFMCFGDCTLTVPAKSWFLW